MMFVLNNERIILSTLLRDMLFPEEYIIRKNFGKCQGNNSTGIILRPSPNLQIHIPQARQLIKSQDYNHVLLKDDLVNDGLDYMYHRGPLGL